MVVVTSADQPVGAIAISTSWRVGASQAAALLHEMLRHPAIVNSGST